MPHPRESMRHLPGWQSPREGRLAVRRHLARRLTIDAEAESPADGKGQIDQFDFQLLRGLEAASDQAIARFGTRPAPPYPRKSIHQLEIKNDRARQNIIRAYARHSFHY
jgi:hypothetical protein